MDLKIWGLPGLSFSDIPVTYVGDGYPVVAIMGCSGGGPRVLGSTGFLLANLENGLPRWVSPSFGVNRVLVGKLGDGYPVVDIMGCLGGGP